MKSIYRITTEHVLYEQVLDLRQRVLRAPLGLDVRKDDLEPEKEQVIFVYAEKEVVIGCVLLQPFEDHAFKLRQMAVDASMQGKGIGTALVKSAESYAKSVGKRLMFLHARSTAQHFYETLGYEVEGAPFTEIGIPHRKMKKLLRI